MRRFLFLLFLFAGSCGPPMPKKPGKELGVSMPFVCTYHGFAVVRGWLVVSEEVYELAEKNNLDVLEYWLECQSSEYEQLKCYVDEEI